MNRISWFAPPVEGGMRMDFGAKLDRPIEFNGDTKDAAAHQVIRLIGMGYRDITLTGEYATPIYNCLRTRLLAESRNVDSCDMNKLTLDELANFEAGLAKTRLYQGTMIVALALALTEFPGLPYFESALYDHVRAGGCLIRLSVEVI